MGKIVELENIFLSQRAVEQFLNAVDQFCEAHKDGIGDPNNISDEKGEVLEDGRLRIFSTTDVGVMEVFIKPEDWIWAH